MSRFKTSASTLLLGGALAALLCIPAGVRYAAAEDAAQPAAAAEKAEDTELAKQMEVIEDGVKKLRRTLKNAEGDAESLKVLSAMQAAAVASKELPPARLAKVPEAEKKNFLNGYRKGMIELIAHLCSIEQAVLDGRHEDAQGLHKKLKDMEEAGHEKYAEEA